MVAFISSRTPYHPHHPCVTFDAIYCSIIINRLAATRLSNQPQDRFRSYRSGRSQKVQLKKSTSQPSLQPQGSGLLLLLGNTCFINFIAMQMTPSSITSNRGPSVPYWILSHEYNRKDSLVFLIHWIHTSTCLLDPPFKSNLAVKLTIHRHIAFNLGIEMTPLLCVITVLLWFAFWLCFELCIVYTNIECPERHQ